jgi:hypothetical protein
MGLNRRNLRELLRDESLSKRQQLTIRLMYKNYGKNRLTYLWLVLCLGWLGVHRYYANSDVMNGLMSPFCVFYPVVAPALFLSEEPMAMATGVGWFAFLYVVAICEMPWHLHKLKKSNTHLKIFLEEHVKHSS